MTYPELIIPCPNGVSASSFRDIIIDLSVEGVHTVRRGVELIATADPSKTDPLIEFATLLAIYQAGGSWTNVKTGIRVLQGAFNDPVPATIPGATYVDEEEVTQNRTWNEWVNASGQEFKLKTGNVDGIFKAVWQGQILDSDALVAAHTDTGVTVLDWSDFIADWNHLDYNPVP